MKSSAKKLVLTGLFIVGSPVLAWADAGFKNSWSSPLSEVAIGTRTVIVRCLDGRITGMREETVAAPAYFAADHGTAPGLRVRIVNETLNTGLAATTPYTDREYDNSSTRLSEIILFAAGREHRGSVFVVAPGQTNRFGYVVYDDRTRASVESGNFAVSVVAKVYPDREEISSDILCNGNPLPPLPPRP